MLNALRRPIIQAILVLAAALGTTAMSPPVPATVEPEYCGENCASNCSTETMELRCGQVGCEDSFYASCSPDWFCDAVTQGWGPFLVECWRPM